MSNQNSITALFEGAQRESYIGTDSLNLLMGPNISDSLGQAMGIEADEVNATEVTLVTLVVDNSASMENMAKEARAAQHGMIDALLGSKQSDGVLMATWTFDPSPVHGYQPLARVPRLDSRTYSPVLWQTPLYDVSIKALGGVVAKTQEFFENGQPIRSVTAIVTDGADNSSSHKYSDVAQLVTDMERQEMHLVMLVGVDDGYTDFVSVGANMGIRPDRILTPQNSPSQLRAAMRQVSQSAVRVSQTNGRISQVGFGATAL